MADRSESVSNLSLEKRKLLEMLLLERAGQLPKRQAIARSEQHSPAPLSFSQQRLWVFEQMNPDSAVYNISGACRLEGRLDLKALERSLNEIIRRHQVLRTTFMVTDGQPVQVVSATEAFSLPVLDLSHFPGAEREAEARKVIAEEAVYRFDLVRGPLVRICLLRLAPNEHVIVITTHHIISDAWSQGILVHELAVLYEAFLMGKPSPLAELPVQYTDFARWQRQYFKSERAEPHIDYWRRKLAGIPPLDLPGDRSRPAMQTFRGATQVAELPQSLCEELKALCQREEATLFMGLLTAFATLVHRYSGQEDIGVGSPFAGRNRSEIEGLIGCFVNMLVLRTNLSDDPSFSSLLKQVREMSIEAQAHADLPFESVVEELRPERDMSRSPLFQVVFGLQNAPMPAFELPGLRLSFLESGGGTAKFDLTLSMEETGQSLSASLEYNNDLFEAATISRMLKHYQTLLEGIIAEPQQPISRLSLMTPAEQHQILIQWNNTKTVYPADRCVHELFEAQAERSPGAVAVVCGDVQISYGELNRRANQLAHYLRQLGVGPEVLVGICVERSAEMMVGLLGILKAGAAYMPLDPAYPMDRLAFMLEDAQVSVLLSQEQQLERLPAHWSHLICLDTDWEQISAADEGNPSPLATADSIAYVTYTSGSTGKPKGTEVRHQSICRLLFGVDYVHLDEKQRILHLSPLAFDASTFEIWGALLHGGRCALFAGRVPTVQSLAEAIERYAINTMWLTASLFNMVIDEAPLILSGIEQLLAGGEALSVSHLCQALRHLPETQLINGYGPTEATTFTCCYRIGRAFDRSARSAPIGPPIGNSRVYILDRHWQPVPAGIAGELYIGGDGLARGYLRRSEATAERFLPNPFADAPGERLYRTGDLARYLADSSIEYLGRIDHQVKIRGFRIELGEIEAALIQYRSIKQAVVSVCEYSPGDKRLAAYLVSESEPAPTPAELREYLSTELPEYMLPWAFVMLDALPLNANGKVDRCALPSPDRAQQKQEDLYEAPCTPVEEVLAGIWCKVLGVERVSRQDNFFALGGDSIRAILIVSRARERSLDLSIELLFRYQVLCELAREINFKDTSSNVVERHAPFSLISNADVSKLPEGIEDAYPLTMLQTGMLFHSESSPGTTTYHDIYSFHLKARLDLEALRAALQQTIVHHPVLRTSFDLSDFSEPIQLVHRHVDVPLQIEDLRHLPEAEQEQKLSAWMEDEKGRSFDWQHPPLLRFRVFLRRDETFQFCLAFHHAILDGWSMATMLTEIFSLYFSFLNQAEDVIAPPGLLFRDFVALERKALGGEESRDYWNQKLSNLTINKLPRWIPAEAEAETPAVRTLSISIDQQTAEGLNRLARIAAAPLKSVLLAAHLRVMELLGGHADVLTGLVSNGRLETTDGERVLGLFLNTLPFRQKMFGGSWVDLVLQVFETEHELLAHRHYPMAQIQRDYGGPSLFETIFNFTHFHVYQNIQEHEGLQVLDIASVAETNYTLMTSFDVDASSSEIQLSLHYNTASLHAEQIKSIGHLYAATLGAMIREPQACYQSHCPLSDEDLRRLLVEWNDTRVAYPVGGCLHQLFEQQVTRTPDHVAIVFEGDHLSYAELNRRANQLAHYLIRNGVEPGALVGILMERSVEMVVGLFAILKAGAAYVPLEPSYPPARLRFMLEDAQPQMIIAQRRVAGVLSDIGLHIIHVDTDWQHISHESAENPTRGVMLEDLAYAIYTSGSTGQPKAAMNSHRGISNSLIWMQATYDLSDAERLVQKTPFSFDVSLCEFFWPLMAGACLIIARPEGHKESAYLAQLIEEQQVTTIHFVPSMLQVFLEEMQPRRFASLKRVLCSGEALPYDLQQRFFERSEAELHNLYGPTEAAVHVTYWACKPDYQRHVVPIGRPVANTRAYLLDRNLQLLPPGVECELLIGGVSVGQGYLNRAELTAERFVPDPFTSEPGARLYRTGDLVRYLGAGEIDYVGRIDHQVKLRGYRIELGEIEAVLAQYASVREAVVLAREDQIGDKRLVAYLAADGNPAPVTGEIRSFMEKRLPEYMVPSAFVVMEKLPLSANGKLDRAALPIPETLNLVSPASILLPRDSVELQLTRIWEDLFDIRPIGIRDNFFLDLGGHSLLAVRLMALIHSRIGKRLSLSTFLHGPTIEQLALALGKDGQPKSQSILVEINAGGSRLPFFCVHPGTGSALHYVHLARYLDRDQPFYALQSPGLEGEEIPYGCIEGQAAYYLEAVKRVQAEGPYFLAGHSYGGIVAFEMAQQLRRDGHQIGLLVILDTVAPSGERLDNTDAPELVNDLELLSEIIGVMERYLNKDIPIDFDEVRHLASEAQLPHILERLKQADIIAADSDLRHIHGLLQVIKSHARYRHFYVPQAYPGRVVLFRAGEKRPEDVANLPLEVQQDSAMGWNHLASEPTEVYVIPGDHITMIAEPYVRVLAGQLQARLSQETRNQPEEMVSGSVRVG